MVPRCAMAAFQAAGKRLSTRLTVMYYLSVLADQPTTRYCILRGLLQTSALTVFRNCQLFANLQPLIHRLATLRSSYEPGPKTISFSTRRQSTGTRWSKRTDARSP